MLLAEPRKEAFLTYPQVYPQLPHFAEFDMGVYAERTAAGAQSGVARPLIVRQFLCLNYPPCIFFPSLRGKKIHGKFKFRKMQNPRQNAGTFFFS